jgi:predicted phosphohydrolase
MSDLHLDFCSDEEIHQFLSGIRTEPADAVALTGDIGIASGIEADLQTLARALAVPVFFVLGNHDYYHGSLRRVRSSVRRLSKRCPSLCWLGEAGSIRLDQYTCLVGHDGWADAGFGDYAYSTVELNDYYLIQEFVGLPRPARRTLMESLAQQSVDCLRDSLNGLPTGVKRVVLLTHVPPFAEVCLAPDGGESDDEWLPHFTNRRLAEFLVEFAEARPDLHLLLLCGHTHTRASAHLRSNLEVRVAGSVYGRPGVEDILAVEALGSGG